MQGFTNQSITPPKADRPHICIREGLWRVSPLNSRANQRVRASLWSKAHDLTRFWNRDRLFRRGVR